jgi:hypothetical protein
MKTGPRPTLRKRRLAPTKRRSPRTLSTCQLHASATMLVNPAASIDLFNTASGVAFADLVIDGQRESWPVLSTRLRAWLRRRYYEATGDAPRTEAVPLSTSFGIIIRLGLADSDHLAADFWRPAGQRGHEFIDIRRLRLRNSSRSTGRKKAPGPSPGLLDSLV